MPKGRLSELTEGLRCEVSLLGGFVNDLLCGSWVQLIARREQPFYGAKRVDDRRQALTEFVDESRYGVFSRRENWINANLRSTPAASIAKRSCPWFGRKLDNVGGAASQTRWMLQANASAA
jgi:hypothetical protein